MSDSIVTRTRACAHPGCAHDRASHYYFPGETKKDAYGNMVREPAAVLTCLCTGCACKAFLEEP